MTCITPPVHFPVLISFSVVILFTQALAAIIAASDNHIKLLTWVKRDSRAMQQDATWKNPHHQWGSFVWFWYEDEASPIINYAPRLEV